MNSIAGRTPEILDCTLRDGSHAVGHTFTVEDTRQIVQGLITGGIRVIEIGKSSGLGSRKGNVSDEEYLDAVKSFHKDAEIGMFCRPEFCTESLLDMAAEKGIGFLRVGTDAGKALESEKVISLIRKRGIKVRFSLMKAHSVSPETLAAEARHVESYGAQVITMMDSTGTFVPVQVREYVSTVVKAVSVPVGFHGHNNLGLAVGNAITALESGASSLDGSLRGLARSAGNAPTELLCAVLGKLQIPVEADLSSLLHFIDSTLPTIVPGLKGIAPLDLIFGLAGFHSRYLPEVTQVSEETGVDLYDLILAVTKLDSSKVDLELARKAAENIRRKKQL